MSNPTRVGFLGLGNMGKPMATRLVEAGFPLTVFDISVDACGSLVSLGASRAESPYALARECDVVCTSLPGPHEADAAYLGPDGIVDGIREGSLCIDLTTNSPQLVGKIHETLVQHGAHLVDAPVSGGVEGARAGSLTILISGEDRSIDRSSALLEKLASRIIPVGKIGNASICKVLHNCAVFCSNLATMECLTAGVKSGVEAKTLIEVFQNSGLGRNLDLQVAMPATLFQGNFEPRFAMKTAYKDMHLATEIGQSQGVPMRLAELCQRDMDTAIERGWGDQDNTIFLTLQEERADAVVRV